MGAIASNYSSDPHSILYIGFDCEFHRVGSLNRVLSYQFFAFYRAGASWCGIIYPNGRRISLSRFLSEAVLKGLELGKTSAWPKQIVLIGHSNLAVITLFSDFSGLKSDLDAIHNTYISLLPFPWRLYDRNNHGKEITVILRDSSLLAPSGNGALHDLGNLIGKDKISLPENQIEKMDELLLRDPTLFEQYALRDPEICVLYSLKIAELNADLTGSFQLPPTLSSIAINHLLELWDNNGTCKHVVLGTEEIMESSWDDTKKRSILRKRVTKNEVRFDYETFTTECYHGGRNEQYFFGAGEKAVWTDWDLAGAYSTALAVIGQPEWDSIRPTLVLADYQPNALGFARVQFRFPDSTRFPCLPVRTDHGLVFPLTGVSRCCSPEVYLAQRLGADLKILNGIVLPSDFNIRPFEEFVVDCTRRRKSHSKGTLDNLFWKEIGNSVYGKLGQGLKRKRCFDSRSGKHRDLPESPITNPFFAAFTTSIIRAVLGEILAGIPQTASVCNATTDGFLTLASDEDVQTATNGPLCRLFAQTRIRICGDPTVLEAKHRIMQPLGWRTRGQATLEPIVGEQFVLAKAGLKPPVHDREGQNEWIISTFLNRTRQSVQKIETFRGLTDIYENGGDLTSLEISRRISMEYDWKRHPVGILTRKIRSVDHLFFETEPWRSVEEFNKCRDQWELYGAGKPVVLKSESDLASFEEYRAIAPMPGIKIPRTGSSLKLTTRQFLRAFVRSEWGLCADEMSYSEIARWLSDGGFPTKKSDLENAKRPKAKLVEGCVIRTAEVERFIAFIREKFPRFDESRLFQTQSDVGSPVYLSQTHENTKKASTCGMERFYERNRIL